MTTYPAKGIPYTPGPWSVDTCDTDLVTADCDGLMICWTSNADRDENDDGVIEANARLIAAAPELLAALEAMRLAYVGHLAGVGADPARSELNRKASAAIAKARGAA